MPHLGGGWRGLGGLGRGGGPLLEGGHAVRHAHGGGVVALRARQEPQLRRHAGRARRVQAGHAERGGRWAASSASGNMGGNPERESSLLSHHCSHRAPRHPSRAGRPCCHCGSIKLRTCSGGAPGRMEQERTWAPMSGPLMEPVTARRMGWKRALPLRPRVLPRPFTAACTCQTHVLFSGTHFSVGQAFQCGKLFSGARARSTARILLSHRPRPAPAVARGANTPGGGGFKWGRAHARTRERERERARERERN